MFPIADKGPISVTYALACEWVMHSYWHHSPFFALRPQVHCTWMRHAFSLAFFVIVKHETIGNLYRKRTSRPLDFLLTNCSRAMFNYVRLPCIHQPTHDLCRRLLKHSEYVGYEIWSHSLCVIHQMWKNQVAVTTARLSQSRRYCFFCLALQSNATTRNDDLSLSRKTFLSLSLGLFKATANQTKGEKHKKETWKRPPAHTKEGP